MCHCVDNRNTSVHVVDCVFCNSAFFTVLDFWDCCWQSSCLIFENKQKPAYRLLIHITYWNLFVSEQLWGRHHFWTHTISAELSVQLLSADEVLSSAHSDQSYRPPTLIDELILFNANQLCVVGHNDFLESVHLMVTPKHHALTNSDQKYFSWIDCKPPTIARWHQVILDMLPTEYRSISRT